MLNLSTAVGFRGEPHYPVSPHGLHLGQRGVDAYPMHAITIAGNAREFKKDVVSNYVPMINRCSIRGALLVTYFFVSKGIRTQNDFRISPQGV